MKSLLVLLENKENAVGEVAGIESDIIDIFIYPDRFNEVGFGSILIVDAGEIKPVGIIVKIAHTSRYSSFTPMKMTRDEIKRVYPDIDLYHSFVSSIVYTSHINQSNEINHFRSIAPRLHDLVYLIDEEEFLDLFFRPHGQWDFSFLPYFFSYGGNILIFRDFINRYRDYFIKRTEDKESIIEAVVNAINRYHGEMIHDVLIQMSEVLGW